jgi:signal transduction histidine kinase/CheY-like chemotaxis protein
LQYWGFLQLMKPARPLDVKTYLRAVAEETQSESAVRFQAAIRGTPVFFALQDRELRYTWIHNPIASANMVPAIGKSDWDIFEADDASKLEGLKRAVLECETGSRHEIEISIGGTRIYFDVILSPLRGLDGSVIGVSTTAIDITTRRRAELDRERALAELSRAKEEAEGMSRAKDDFLARLSHELRTPLTPVIALLDALPVDELPESTRNYMEVIRRNVELESRLIDDLLDHTRIINGKLRLLLETVDAHDLVRSVLEICRGEIEGNRLELAVELGAGRSLLQADPARLQQVFWNVVKNAVKFTPPGGSIAIRSKNGPNGDLVIEVQDSGIGIDTTLLPVIFEAFRQGESTTPRGNITGLGLGLAISKSLMDLHGGQLMAMSEGRDRGALFTLSMKTVEVPDATIPAGDTGGSALRPEGTTILLVEDHADTAMMMKLLLERKGYRVKVAPSIAEALDVAARDGFDLLISDIGLPDGSGIDLINALSKRRPVKGIALSGFGMEEDIKRSIEAGFAEHLIKPVTYQKLREAIQRLLS